MPPSERTTFYYALVQCDRDVGFLDKKPGVTLLMRSTGDPRKAQDRATRLAGMLQDLDRCEHGRHEGDNCNGCDGGVSTGNPVPESDRIIGFDISGRAIWVPRRGEEWEYEHERERRGVESKVDNDA